MSKATQRKEIFPILTNQYFPMTKSCYKYCLGFSIAPNTIDLMGNSGSKKQVKLGYQLFHYIPGMAFPLKKKDGFICHATLSKFYGIFSCDLGRIT